MATYIISPASGGKDYEIEADSVTQDGQTAATEFTQDGELVARLFNVSFRKKPDTTPAP